MNLQQARKPPGFCAAFRIGCCAVFLLLATRAGAAWELAESLRLGTANGGLTHVQQTVVSGSRRAVTLHVVLFDRKKCALAVVDNPRGEGDLASAMRGRGALAGTNGGYFHPDRTPLGLVISDGKTIHPRQAAKLLSGLLVVKNGGAVLMRPASFKSSPFVSEALQAGPWLVDHGKAVPGLNATRSAARTVVLADAGGVRALLVSDAVTLAEMGEILASASLLPDVKIERALNLDGGSSTGLWVDAKPSPFYLCEWKDVRNYLAIVPSRK